MRMIDADALLKRYDETHVGPPGAARKLIEEAPTVGGWISVKDSLPNEYEYTYEGDTYSESGYYLCHIGHDRDKAVWPEVLVGYTVNGKWHIEGDYMLDDKITHWMPLPEPPEEVSGDA